MIRVNGVRGAFVAIDGHRRFARVLVDLVDGVVEPVGHKQLVFKEGDAFQVPCL